MTQGEKIRLVIADDHPIFRDGLCRLLAMEEDFDVVAQAQDGRQVLDVLQQHEPDILLLDLNMPGLDGLATLQRLQIAKSKTRVIVVTASDDKNEFVQAMKLGASGIVLKQTDTELLIRAIRKVHGGEIWLDSHTTAAVIRLFVPNDEVQQPSLDSMPVAPPQRERERSPLSQREREIVALVAQGFKNKEMAEKMFISEQTVKNHLHNIFDKLGVRDRLELALYGIDDGLADGPWVRAGGKPRLPYRPPRAAAAEPPEDPLIA
ncbi:MAG: response regulator transcription factor [Candidatus Solibacter sp.]